MVEDSLLLDDLAVNSGSPRSAGACKGIGVSVPIGRVLHRARGVVRSPRHHLKYGFIFPACLRASALPFYVASVAIILLK